MLILFRMKSRTMCRNLHAGWGTALLCGLKPLFLNICGDWPEAAFFAEIRPQEPNFRQPKSTFSALTSGRWEARLNSFHSPHFPV